MLVLYSQHQHGFSFNLQLTIHFAACHSAQLLVIVLLWMISFGQSVHIRQAFEHATAIRHQNVSTQHDLPQVTANKQSVPSLIGDGSIADISLQGPLTTALMVKCPPAQALGASHQLPALPLS